MCEISDHISELITDEGRILSLTGRLKARHRFDDVDHLDIARQSAGAAEPSAFGDDFHSKPGVDHHHAEGVETGVWEDFEDVEEVEVAIRMDLPTRAEMHIGAMNKAVGKETRHPLTLSTTRGARKRSSSAFIGTIMIENMSGRRANCSSRNQLLSVATFQTVQSLF